MNTNIHQISLAMAIVAGAAISVDAGEYQPGVAEFKASHHGAERKLNGHVWYPTLEEGEEDILRGSAIWSGISGHLDAPIAPDVFPVVLISHGMYGNSLNQIWLAKRLAAEGIISIIPNHPGTTTWDRDPDQARQLWLRATDLSASLDAMLSYWRVGDHMDPTRVAAIGHSLGGYTVMAAAGARHDVAHFHQQCSVIGDDAGCAALNMWQVGHDPADHEMLQSDRSDPRIRTVIPLDLGGTQAFSPESLQEIDIPVLVLGSGRADMLDQAVESRALAGQLPADLMRHVELEDAGHFDFMGVCRDGGLEILKAESPEDAVVCVKGTQQRAAQHDRIFALVLDQLKRTGVLSE